MIFPEILDSQCTNCCNLGWYIEFTETLNRSIWVYECDFNSDNIPSNNISNCPDYVEKT